jgi:hypothetical protein
MIIFDMPDFPILTIFAGNGFTERMYKELRKEVDWEHNRPQYSTPLVLITQGTSVWLISGSLNKILIINLIAN